MRCEKLGRIFMQELSRELHDASLVKTDDTGSMLALQLPDGEAIAYVFDSDHLKLTRLVRGSNLTNEARTTTIFPPDVCVKACSFSVSGNTATSYLTLVDEAKQDSQRVMHHAFFQSSAELRVRE